MNYLAHLFLAHGDAPFRAGALAGDFVRGILPADAADPFTSGIRHHRAMDSFTDCHPAVRQARHRFPAYRHYSRIIVDVFLDHMLALTWSRWSPREALPQFAARTYDELMSQRESMPFEMRLVVERMSAGDWLSGYARRESVRLALRGISVRIGRGVALETAVDYPEEVYGGVREDFMSFFPEVIAESEQWLATKG